MKIVSLAQLGDFLDQELAWRRRELTTAKLMVQSAKREHERALLIRGAVCLLYSHWERYIKEATTGYLKYISSQGLNLCDLTTDFVALCMRSKLRTVEGASRFSVHRDVTSLLLSDMRVPAEIPWQDAVEGGNLNSELFREIASIIGLEYKGFATKEKLIDYVLLGSRNRIAHGYQVTPDVSEYVALHDQVVPLIERFRNEVENAAASAKYRRVAATT